MKRLLALAAFLILLAVPAAVAQSPPRVCEGLTICSPIAGPWVIVPGPSPPRRARRRCGLAAGMPDGFVGGLDARVANPWVEVHFPGLMGSPVNPGITTRRSTVFEATSVGPAGVPSSFIPFAGCIPAEGGPRTPTGVGSTAAPQQLGPGPIRRVVRVVEVRQQRVRAGLTCKRGQRLVGAEASAGIFAAIHPTRRQLDKVHLTRQLTNDHVWITVTRGDLAARIPVQVQIHALCAPRYNT